MDKAFSAAADASAIVTLTKMLDGLKNDARFYTNRRYPICGPNACAASTLTYHASCAIVTAPPLIHIGQ